MDLTHILSAVSGQAGHAIIAFAIAVAVDDVLGVLASLRTQTFDFKKLPSWLETQVGTKKAAALLGLVATTYVSGGDIRTAALAALTAGGGALTLSLVSDIAAKAKTLALGATPATPA